MLSDVIYGEKALDFTFAEVEGERIDEPTITFNKGVKKSRRR